MTALIEILLLLTAVFLIVLVLIQRGKGGGLAGAFGGLGGQSAFGTKAGDLFTRITIGVVIFWIVLCIFTVKYYGRSSSPLQSDLGDKAPVRDGVNAPASTEKNAPGAPGPGAEGGSQPQPAPSAPPAAPGSGSAPAKAPTGGS